MASFDDTVWGLALDYSCFMDDASSPNNSWVNTNHSSSFDIDFAIASSEAQQESSLKDGSSRKRTRTDACSTPATKACRERLRREKFNDSFLDLSSTLEPGRAAKTDKLAILTDAIRVLNQLRTKAEDFKEENRKLHEEIESLKAEKNELRAEKLSLKAEKEKMEQQLTTMTAPSSGLMTPYPAPFHAAANKMALYPTYGMFPMWHYLPTSTCDTSRDHELRPPAA